MITAPLWMRLLRAYHGLWAVALAAAAGCTTGANETPAATTGTGAGVATGGGTTGSGGQGGSGGAPGTSSSGSSSGNTSSSSSSSSSGSSSGGPGPWMGLSVSGTTIVDGSKHEIILRGLGVGELYNMESYFFD